MVLFAFQKVSGLVLLRSTVGLKNWRHFFIQSEVKLKPTVFRLHTFSRPLHWLFSLSSVIDHRGRQNVVRTSVIHSAIASCAAFLLLQLTL